MKVGVVVFPGSNCDVDCFHVAREVMGADTHYLWHQETTVDGYDLIILPGGFSYGDYLRSGAVASLAPIMHAIKDYAAKGGLVLGICNGFQILLEAGMLPGAMLRNRQLQFRCQHVYLRVENEQTPFTCALKKGQILNIPIAHMEGNYYADETTLAELKRNSQILFRYVDESGEATAESNPNGALENIAGICNKAGNVLGMMPHPERAAERILGSADGKLIFDSILKHWGELK